MKEGKDINLNELEPDKEVIYWIKRKEVGFLKAFWLTWKEIIFHPKRFFSKITSTLGLGASIYFGIIVYLLCLLVGLWYIWIISIMGVNLYPEIRFSTLLRIYFWIVLLTPFGVCFIIFIKSVFLHSILWLLRARKGFKATFKVVAYSTAPNVFYLFCVPMGLFAVGVLRSPLLSSLRIVLGYPLWGLMVLGTIMTTIWPLVLLIIGVKYAHNISFFRSICGVVIYYALITLIVMVFTFGFRRLTTSPRPMPGLTSKSEEIEEESKFIGQEFPKFNIDDLNFREVNLDDFRGKVVVVAFWPDYYTPSENEITILNRLCSQYKSEKVLISAISVRKDFGRIKRLAKETKIIFQILIDWGELSEHFWGTISSHYTPVRPMIFILDKGGIIRYAYHTRRVVPPAELLSKKIDELLNEKLPKSPAKKTQRVQIKKPKIAEEGIIEYEATLYFKDNLVDYNVTWHTPKGVSLVDDLGKNIIKEPPRAFEKRMYGVIPLGKSRDNAFKCILDFDEPPQKNFIFRKGPTFIRKNFIFYFDKNNNNDLNETDEKISGMKGKVRVDNIQLKYRDGIIAPYCLRVYFYFNDWEKSYRVSYYRDCAMEGQIKLGEETYRIALLDDNSDGLYTISDDYLLFDFNQDGKLDGRLVKEKGSEYYKVKEGIKLKDTFKVNNLLYKVVYVSEKGDKIRVRQVSQ
ncbi:MAG: hypothetical protein B6D55_00640 [Candidatus Omnitrophica bacterium 4484_70.2]|nr:MAG: hypothetical protein B6D55_00640 [Candidatus Omnitrophica bacterium 4484_70.2]